MQTQRGAAGLHALGGHAARQAVQVGVEAQVGGHAEVEVQAHLLEHHAQVLQRLHRRAADGVVGDQTRIERTVPGLRELAAKGARVIVMSHLGRPKGKPKGRRDGKPEDKGPRSFEARPPRPEKKIDPDNPFAAALMGFKGKV